MTAANFAGSAVRVVVAAPVAAINPEAREVLKREVSSGGEQIVDGQITY
ncbi:hypothetical protein [Rhizobium azibense]